MTEAVGAAVVTKNIELTIDFGALAALSPAMTGTQAKMHVLQAIERVQQYIEQQHVWPPA